MKCELIAEIVDCEGTRYAKPKWKKHHFVNPSFPMGLFIRSKIQQHCQSLEEIQSFLRSCRYVSDQKQFNKADYWLPPDRFEELGKGDCEDFSLWTWRQLIDLGYESRLVCGRFGSWGAGHAWVTYQEEGKWFLLEPTAAKMRGEYPRLMCLKYHPEISIRWNGKKLEYYEHQANKAKRPLSIVLPLYPAWIVFQGEQWLRFLLKLPLALLRRGTGSLRQWLGACIAPRNQN